MCSGTNVQKISFARRVSSLGFSLVTCRLRRRIVPIIVFLTLFHCNCHLCFYHLDYNDNCMHLVVATVNLDMAATLYNCPKAGLLNPAYSRYGFRV